MIKGDGNGNVVISRNSLLPLGLVVLLLSVVVGGVSYSVSMRKDVDFLQNDFAEMKSDISEIRDDIDDIRNIIYGTNLEAQDSYFMEAYLNGNG